MTEFRCTVLSDGGHSSLRTITAPDRKSAVAKLIADGLVPIEIGEGPPGFLRRLNEPLAFGGKLRPGEQSLVLTQLAMLVRSGLPVDRSLELLRDQAPGARQRDLIGRAFLTVRGGGTLANALEALHSFPAYVVGVVRAAERGGRLGDALVAIAARLREATTARRQLVTALTYPTAVLIATVIALVLVLTMVVPQFEPVFAGEETRLPTLTRVVLALSRGVGRDPVLLAGSLVMPPLLVWLFVRSAAGHAFLNANHRRVPGLMLRDQYIAGQFMALLSTLVLNGVTVVDALPLARDALGSGRWRDGLAMVETRVREGSRLSAALSATSLLPSAAIRLVEVGERSGRLGATASQASEFLVEISRARIQRIVALANPVAMILLGGVVAALVGGVMLGIFALGDFAS